LFAGRFERLTEVAQGGIGNVDSALDPVIGRRVAIKTLRAELKGEEPVTAKFADEAQITGQLDHPNIVPIYDLGEDEDGPFIVMKLNWSHVSTSSANERFINSAHGRDPHRCIGVRSLSEACACAPSILSSSASGGTTREHVRRHWRTHART
jgi:hypothetical protein